jgi:hypothetical protein
MPTNAPRSHPRPRPVAPEGVPDPPVRPKPREIARARRRQRERRYKIVGLVALLVVAGLVAAGAAHGGYFGGDRRGSGAATREDVLAQPPGLAGDGAAVPSRGPGTFAYAAGTGPVVGTRGPLRRFRVAVESGTQPAPDGFAAAAEQILAESRGWTAGGTVRFQRVPQAGPAEFTLYLATPGTSEQMCAKGGLHTGGYASCRLPGQVILNLARWLTGAAGYGDPLPTYRQFALNHEVGRELGYGNESCPGPGQPAPVMQQQTLGLSGCVANPWPYLGGKLYQGNAIP